MAEGITHIDTSTTAPKLADGVVLLQDLNGVGEAPGVTAYVHYNGPTDQLATMCTGMAVLEPGTSPHPPHRHPEEEFMIVAAGTGEIVVNGQTTQVAAGSVMYCAADVLHGITNTGNVPMTFYFPSGWAELLRNNVATHNASDDTAWEHNGVLTRTGGVHPINMPRKANGGTFAALSLLLLCMFATGCKYTVSDRPVGAEVRIKVPLGLPELPIPKDNPPTADTIALGRKLFYDKRISVDATLSCASCHDPHDYFTDGRNVSAGVRGTLGTRNAPTILNAAYLPFQFWDGRASTLEEQAAFPIADPNEMSQAHAADVSKLGDDPAYRAMFKKSFGTDDVTIGRVEAALASFERTALSGNSAFDRYRYGGDATALTPAQLRGFLVYLDPTRGNCAACHSVGATSALFTDGKFHNIGEGVNDQGGFSDVGRFHETKVATDTGAFKTATLRNIAKTAPYMHDGSLKTLKEVVDFYAGGGNSNPYLDPEMKKIHLSAGDRADLVEFLQSLTGDMPPNIGPPEGK